MQVANGKGRGGWGLGGRHHMSPSLDDHVHASRDVQRKLLNTDSFFIVTLVGIFIICKWTQFLTKAAGNINIEMPSKANIKMSVWHTLTVWQHLTFVLTDNGAERAAQTPARRARRGRCCMLAAENTWGSWGRGRSPEQGHRGSRVECNHLTTKVSLQQAEDGIRSIPTFLSVLTCPHILRPKVVQT